MEEQKYLSKLAGHLSGLGMGYPTTEALVEILKETFSELEAEVALAIPTKMIPLSPTGLDDILKGIDLPREKLTDILEGLVLKRLHNCNCCGCACWNVGNIRRRKIPRDLIMAVYFMRITDEDQCAQCGACVDICPVDALRMEEGPPIVDNEWCIGCGLCATVCPTDSARMQLRPDRTGICRRQTGQRCTSGF